MIGLADRCLDFKLECNGSTLEEEQKHLDRPRGLIVQLYHNTCRCEGPSYKNVTSPDSGSAHTP